jgi:NADH-quinone oxidoreductase subunit L
MVNAFDLVPLIAALPFLSFVIAVTVGRWLPKEGALPGVAATAGSLVLSLWAFLAVRSDGTHYENELYTWIDAGSFELTFGVLVDPLSTMMLVVVSLVAFLVHVFSMGYMNDDELHREKGGFPRYYAGLGLFSASMLAFVFSSNLLQAFIFFELVGLCSWILIGFWFREEAPPSAAKKAFLVTRFGDYFFLVGVVGILATFGTAGFAQDGFPQIAAHFLETGEGADAIWVPGDLDTQQWFSILGLLVLGGVVGKSAQFPLHTWLPDAMEGPTPVSALIHAATMVAAGVYLVARMFGFYAGLPTVLAIIAFVGGFTALFAATMGVVKDDIKQVLAYSTISQYGYMMLALGVGGYVAASFHLMNHAFFKALLFLGAGAVIVATHHHQDMWKLGGLKEHMPVTYYAFLAGSLALAGIIPFSGFWSKDEVLYDALLIGLEQPLFLAAYAMGLLAVFFTGFYTFRMVFLTFHGEPRTEHAADPEPLRWNTKGPLAVLGVLAAVTGLLNMKPVAELLGTEDILYLEHWLNSPEGGEFSALSYDHYHHVVAEVAGLHEASLAPYAPAAISLALAIGGALLAKRLYDVPEPERATERLGTAGRVAQRNYYLDEFQVWLATGVTEPIARACNAFDQGIIDGAVNATASVSLFSGERVRRIQSGLVTNYVVVIVMSLIVFVLAVGIAGGWFL